MEIDRSISTSTATERYRVFQTRELLGMALKRLQIQGFKTFANRTEIEFSPGVTAIVGPNGSGKSNLVDAIRWVLGEQSPSLIRTKRSEDVIFTGSTSRSAAGMAEVSITIDNSARLLPVDFNEVTVARRAYRSGENEYLLNRSRVRLRDIVEVTRALSTGYSVVGQGLVDSILSLRPEERRHLFEQAADISGYQAKRVEAERRLAQTEANLTRLADILAELSPRLRQLERQARLAAAYAEAAAELRRLLRQWYGRELGQREAELASARQAEIAGATRVQQARSALGAARELAANLAGQVEALAATLAHSRQDRDRLRAEAAAASQSAAVLDERARALEREIEGAEQARAEASTRHEQATREHERGTTALGTLDRELAARRTDLAEAEAACNVDAGRAPKLSERIRALGESRARAEAREADFTARAADSQRRQAELLAQGDERGVELEQQQQALAKLAAEYAQALADATVLAEGIAAAKARREERVTALDEVSGELRRLEQEQATRRADEAGLRARLETLGRLQESFAGLHAGVKAVLAAARAGRLRGVAGVVAELVRVPAALEVALEVALGGHAQDLVVETWSDADTAIHYLKQQRAGRVTLLPLDTLRVPARARFGEGPGILGCAADLAKHDGRFAPVVALLLGRILVVQELDIAHRELKRVPPGASIVTVAGEIVRTSGAVSGGSMAPQAGLLSRGRELRELPGRLSAVEAARAAAEARAGRLQQRRAEVERELAEINAELTAGEREQQRLAQKLARTELDLTSGRQRTSWLAEALQQIENERQGLGQREAEASLQAEETRRTLADLAQEEAVARQEQADWEATTAEQRGRVETLRVQLAVTEASVRHRQAELRELLRALQAAESGATASEERLQRARETRDRTEDELIQAQGGVARLQASLAATSVTLSEQETRSSQLRAKWDAARSREAELSELVLEAETRHGELAVRSERARAERDALQARAREELGADDSGEAAPADEQGSADLDARLVTARNRVQRMGNVNHAAAQEYSEADERHR
ncbi:MAG: chromosome segregation protein SMC, partial [Chloroflexi bacterium]|nr:chromosome segregation protein SMC [Chloroflexota bacterium]